MVRANIDLKQAMQRDPSYMQMQLESREQQILDLRAGKINKDDLMRRALTATQRVMDLEGILSEDYGLTISDTLRGFVVVDWNRKENLGTFATWTDALRFVLKTIATPSDDA